MFFLGYKLTKLRTDKKLSMQELAEKIGVQQSNISDLENGVTKSPRQTTINKLRDFFGVNSSYFYISGEDIAEYFPKEMSQEQINFVLDSDKVKYIKMAMKLSEAHMTDEILDVALMLILKSSVARCALEKPD